MQMKHVWIGGILILLTGALTLANQQELLGQSATVDAPHKFPPHSFLNNLDGVNLIDQHGRPFEPADLINHVVLFNFIFTNCPATCPMQTKILADIFRGLPENVRSEVRFISVSIDPVNDTPDRLRDFSKTMNADLDGWVFLTGDPAQIDKLTERLHIFDESETGETNKPQIHRTSLWLVDKQGRMLQRYRGDPPNKERLGRELAQVSRMKIH